MEFAKILKNCKPSQGFTNMDVTEAQLEDILEAGTSVPLPEHYWDHFHVSFLPQSVTQEEPPVIVLAAKEGELATDVVAFYSGMIVGGMVLQITNLLLGFRYVTKAELEEKGRKMPVLPVGYEAIQMLAVGYPIEEEEKREAFYGHHNPPATITRGLD